MAGLFGSALERVQGHMKEGKATTIILVLVFIIGLSLLLYPSVSDYWNSFHQSRAIISYAQNISSMNNEEYQAIIDSALEYNATLAQTGSKWIFKDPDRELYNQELNFDRTGNMGYIDIPKIKVTLPVYHGTSASVLQTSIGHLEGTSLPVGGESSHCVLSGHRGLPSAKLFSDLDKLVSGDTFTLNILNETFTYEVDQILVVLPQEVDAINIEEGQDFCTLLTCTPYGINTHRLLVRAHRVANAQGPARVIADAIQLEPRYIAPFLAVPVLLMLTIFTFATSGKKKRN